LSKIVLHHLLAHGPKTYETFFRHSIGYFTIYGHLYVSFFIPQKIQTKKRRLVIKDGVQIPVESFRVLPDAERSAENAFDWLTSQTDYTMEPERGYESIKGDSTFVFKTSGADVSIVLLNDFRSDSTKQTEITSAFFAPFKNQTLSKIINFNTGIFIKKITLIFKVLHLCFQRL